MPLLPAAPPLGAPPPGPPPMMGGGLAPPAPPPQMPAPAGAAVLGLAPLVPQQDAELQALKQKQAMEAMAVALQAIQGLPNPAAEAAQTEPSGMVPSQPGDPSLNPGAGGY